MRRRLVVMFAAVTAMVAVAFLAPLFLLVQDLAYDRAINRAERDVEEVARVLALLFPERPEEDGPWTPEEIRDVTAASFPEGAYAPTVISIVSISGPLYGPAPNENEDLTVAFGPDGVPFRDPDLPGGEAVYVPVPITAEGPTVVVRGFVPDETLKSGVVESWIVLGALGVLLTSIAVIVADRLGRSVVRPVLSLSESTVRLGEGDLAVRVEPDGPAEIREAGAQFNRLAERITKLLQSEREQAADLSHRLRTPLTAVRLDAEALPEGETRERLLDDLAELERMVSFVIEEARRPIRSGIESVEFTSLVVERVDFWRPLAEEQERPITLQIPQSLMWVRIDQRDAEALVDAALGNIYAHTDEGVAIHIGVESTRGRAILRIEDAGPGFPDLEVLERGTSGGSSTGLGLDIIRRTAEAAGGRLEIGRGRTLPGAALVVSLPRVRTQIEEPGVPRRGRSPAGAPRPRSAQSSSASASAGSSSSSVTPSDPSSESASPSSS